MFLHLKLLIIIYQPHLPVAQDLLSCRIPQFHAGSPHQEPAGTTEKSYNVQDKNRHIAMHSILRELGTLLVKSLLQTY